MAKRLDDLDRCRLEVSQMMKGKLFDRKCRLDPKNVDRAVHARVIQQRHEDGRQRVVVRRLSVASADEAGGARAVTSRTRVRKNLVELFRIARDPKQLDKILADTCARGYGTRASSFVGGGYGQPPHDNALAAILVPLLDHTRVHGSINILWIKTAFTIEQFALHHLADLKAAAVEIVQSLRHGSMSRQGR